MFGNLFGKKEDDAVEHVFKDRAYMSSRARMKAILTLAKNDGDFIFIAWFSDTAKQFRSYFAENGISESRIVEAQQFHTHQLATKKPVFVEHYPLHSKKKHL